MNAPGPVRRLWRAAFFACAFSIAAGTAFAQSPRPEIPPSADPGQIERNLRAPAAPRTSPGVPEFRRGSPALPPAAGGLSLTLGSVTVEGSTVYSEEDLAPFYEDRLGRQISLAEVFGIADAITAKYRNDGYMLSRAILPPQTIDGGAVTIRIVEGYVNSVRIEGATHRERDLLNAYAAKIKRSRPLAVAQLERYLLLIDDLPGISSKAVLNPAEDAPGAADLAIVVEEETESAFVRVDNRGSKFNGPIRYWASAAVNSFANAHDTTAVRFLTADPARRELTYVDARHEFPVGAEGGKVHVHAAYTDSRPGHTLRELKTKSRSRSVTTGFSIPVVRSRAENLSLSADFTIRDSETLIFANRLSRDRVRFITVGTAWDIADGSGLGGVTLIGIYIDRGLNALGSTGRSAPDLSREKGRADFTRIRLNTSRVQPLGGRWSLFTDFRSQFSLHKLLASEEFGLGGEGCGRAFDSAQVTGDHGGCLLAELRYGHTLGGGGPVRGYQVYGFADVGRVWRKFPGALERTADLSSAGFGVRLNFTESLSGSLEAAWPIDRKADSRTLSVGSGRGFFSLTARF